MKSSDSKINTESIDYIYLEDLVPLMLNPRTWDTWIPKYIQELMPSNKTIGIAFVESIGWVIWERDTFKLYSPTKPLEIKLQNPHYKEPKYCGYGYWELDETSTPPDKPTVA